MKHLLIGAGMIALLAFGIIEDQKKFKVEFTQQEWQDRYDGITIAREQLKKSDLPSKTVVYVSDSLLGKFQADLVAQLAPQIQAAMKDTSDKKSKK